MERQIATNQNQSARLLQCGVSADTADMIGVEPNYGYECEPWSSMQGHDTRGYFPAWSLSALLTLLPFKIHSCKYEYWLDVAPINFGTQWSIGYYCTEKPRTIKGLTHNENLIECAVQEIVWLTINGYKLNEI